MPGEPTILILAGPTAVGKSAVAMELASEWGAELISADARQVYRYLDIGTAKPDLSDRSRVTHHLIDICDPEERYSAARFAGDALAALDRVRAAGRPAIVVGGTGLYLKALREGLFPSPPVAPETREAVDAMLSSGGADALRRYLRDYDPRTLSVIDPQNPARLRRAVEYHLQTSESIESARRGRPVPDRPYRFFPVVLVVPRVQLYEQIQIRVDSMLARGWLDEVASLSGRYDFSLSAFDAVGYRQLQRVVRGELAREAAREDVVRMTRRYAKRQLTWFTHQGSWTWVSNERGVTSKIASALVRHAEDNSA